VSRSKVKFAKYVKNEMILKIAVMWFLSLILFTAAWALYQMAVSAQKYLPIPITILQYLGVIFCIGAGIFLLIAPFLKKSVGSLLVSLAKVEKHDNVLR